MLAEVLNLISKKQTCALTINRTYVQTIKAILDPQLII